MNDITLEDVLNLGLLLLEEANNSLPYPNNYSKERILDAFICAGDDAGIHLGYARNDAIGVMLKKVFPNTLNKPCTRTYFQHLLYISGYKICCECNELKELEDFGNRSDRPSGIQSVCKCCLSVSQKESRNTPEYKEWRTRYNEENKEYIREVNKAYREKRNIEQPGYAAAQTAKHRALQEQRTPIWLTQSDFIEINRFYNDCPQGYHVDHDIPKNSPLVSGLHVLSNLQYLPAKENMSKGNKFNIIQFNNL